MFDYLRWRICATLVFMTNTEGQTEVTERAMRAALRARRAALNITVDQLAERASISHRTMDRYLNGETRLFFGALVSIAAALDTTVEQLVREAIDLIEKGLIPDE